MEGIIINYRGSHKTQYDNQIIIKLESISSKEEAHKVVNKKVVWTTPTGKEIVGVIKKEHGNKGAVRATFQKGLPGQSLGTKVKVV